MLRKDEKKAMTRIALLSVGWGLGLDRFYEGRTRDGFLSLIGWGAIFISFMILSPCHGYDYADKSQNVSEMFSPYLIAPLGFGVYGLVLVLRKGFRLLRQFEAAED